MKMEQNQPNGSLKISQEVIASIAQTAAKEIEGVAALAPSRLQKQLNKNTPNPKAVSIEVHDDAAVINISVIVKAGCKIRLVSEELQKAIKDAVQTMTGMTVSKVNVHVDGIRFAKDAVAKTEAKA